MYLMCYHLSSSIRYDSFYMTLMGIRWHGHLGNPVSTVEMFVFLDQSCDNSLKRFVGFASDTSPPSTNIILLWVTIVYEELEVFNFTSGSLPQAYHSRYPWMPFSPLWCTISCATCDIRLISRRGRCISPHVINTLTPLPWFVECPKS